MHRKIIINFATIIAWIGFFIVSGTIYYVNHYLPKGPMYATGEYVCINDDQGPCEPDYIEDVRNLNIPDWAKFFKKSEGELIWMGLLILAVILPAFKIKKN